MEQQIKEAHDGKEKEEKERLLSERREALIDEINILVTTLGPKFLHRGMTMNEGFEAIIACIKHLHEQWVGEQKLRMDMEAKIKDFMSPPPSCTELEGVPI